MSSRSPAAGKERVLYVLKTRGPQTAARIARRLAVTVMAIRQHLAVLAGEQLVEYTDDRRRVGRPARLWRLTPKAYDRFPDCHAEFAVSMLQAIKGVFGDKALERLTSQWSRQQMQSYRARMPRAKATLAKRVALLTRLRREDGYMAESHSKSDGTITLVENHCSIGQAARLCPMLCARELELFRAVLGEDVAVDRAKHILAGDRCCAYIIANRSKERVVSASV